MKQPRSLWKGAGQPAGVVIMGLGLAMVVCGLLGVAWWLLGVEGAQSQLERRQSYALLAAGGVTAALGWLLRRHGRGTEFSSMGRPEAIFAVAIIWLAAGVLGGLPFLIGAGMAPMDAFFEAVSGFTTTGATVIANIQGTLTRPLLLWRSLIQWLGGMGIVVLFVAVFPNVGVGAKLMFRGEVPGALARGMQPRIAETSSILWRLYVTLTATEAALLMALGMDPFEAVCHALTTLSTGGFSTRDSSIGAFDSPAIEMVVAAFMLIGAINFNVLYAMYRSRSLRIALRSLEFRVYVLLIALMTVALTISILPVHGNDPVRAFRYGFFTVAAFISSTTFSTDSYMAYPSLGLVLVLLLMFIGGSSGSTAGGIKIERVVLLAKTAWAQIRRTFRPNLVQVVRMDRTAVGASVLADVAIFLAVYVGCLWVCVLLITFIESVPVPTAFGASLSCLSNMGPAPFFIGADNFASYSGASKFVFSVAMILGRLEFFTLFALLLPDFWKR